MLEQELAAVTEKRLYPEQALAGFKAKLEEATQALDKFKGELPAEQLAQAYAALARGDTAAAETLFAKVLQAGKEQAQKAAEAAFQLRELAFARIDYAKAYASYREAATLQPDDPVYRNIAGRLAQELGRYPEAQPFF